MQAWVPIVVPVLLSLAGALSAWFVKRSPDARDQIERDIELRQMLSLSSEDGEARKALTASIETTARNLVSEKITWTDRIREWGLVLGWMAMLLGFISLFQLPQLEIGTNLRFVIQLVCFGLVALGSMGVTTWFTENLTKLGRTRTRR